MTQSHWNRARVSQGWARYAWKLSWAAGLCLAFGACAHAPPTAQPFVLEPTGMLLHRPSSFEFPPEIADFQRADTLRYDASGRDVSVGYFDYSVPVVATIFVYPTQGRTLADEFAVRQAEIGKIHDHAETLALSDTVVTPARRAALAGTFVFQELFAGRRQLLRSRLVVARDGPDFVEYRLSYPAALAISGSQRVDRFLQAFAWPQ